MSIRKSLILASVFALAFTALPAFALKWVSGKKARIITPIVSVLAERRHGSELVEQTFKGKEFELVQEGETWLKVKTAEGREGWILKTDAEILDSGAHDLFWLLPLTLIIAGLAAFIIYQINKARKAKLAAVLGTSEATEII